MSVFSQAFLKLVGFAVVIPTSLHAENRLKDLTQYPQVEKTVINCIYPSLLKNDLTSQQIATAFSPPTSVQCESAYREFNRITEAKETLKLAFPSAITALKITREQEVRPRFMSEIKGEVPILATHARPNAFELGFSPWATEHRLRKIVGIGKPPEPCSAPSKKLNLFSQEDLFSDLLLRGMNCLLRDYRAQSVQSNPSPKAQALFEKQLHLEATKRDLTEKKLLENTWVFHFPQLGYDLEGLPFQGKLEKLDVATLKSHVEGLGGKFFGIERVTLMHLDDQVSVSLQQINTILNSSEFQRVQPKVLFIGRSMGALVLRELLTRHPRVRAKVNGILLIGATPWGSVIADYRSRADVYDEAFAPLVNPISVGIFKIGGILRPDFIKIRDAAMKIKNIESMSHLQFKPQKLAWDIPTVNVILLPQSIENFFGNSERIAKVDVTMLLTSLYGPTEGSSPLAGASLDTKYSVRLFDSRYNHLAFWELEERRALALWNTSFYSITKMMKDREL